MVDGINILITGADGQLGSSINYISKAYDYNFHFKTKEELNIGDFPKLENLLKKLNISTVINCAAYTDVENSEKNNDLADLINYKYVKNLARLCFILDIQLIHISTDYVFSGENKTEYKEDDIPCPVNYYGLSKLKGENSILDYDLRNSLIIRTSWLYSKSKNNFVQKIKLIDSEKIRVVDNEIGSPTNALDLALAILKIIPKIKNDKTEIYHFSNIGSCSRYELAVHIKKFLKKNFKIIPVNNYNSLAKRPKHAILNSNKFENNFKIKIKTWQESLDIFLKSNT